MSAYPKMMVHPHHVRGAAVPVPGTDPVSGKNFVDYVGTPDRFPPVEVNNEDQEGEHRAKGYIAMGETVQPTVFQEYPMELRHPGYRPAMIASEGNPGTSACFPPVSVNSRAQEDEYAAKGYARPGKSDPDASHRAIAAPYDPTRAPPQEFPKMDASGAVHDPHAAPTFQKYPMYVGQAVVNNEAEERIARQALGLGAEKPNDAAPQARPLVVVAGLAPPPQTAPLRDLSPIEQPEDEHSRLMRVAQDRGIRVHPKIGLAKLRQRLEIV